MDYKRINLLKKHKLVYLAVKFTEMSKNTNQKEQSLQIPKIIVFTANFFQLISAKLTVRFAAKLFTTPIRHSIPKRELHMNLNSRQQSFRVEPIKKDITIYFYGDSSRKILLVHGWSGRGTQLVKIADELINQGFAIVSFDAPAHGKSKGNFSIMTEFIASIHEIDKQFGPFDFAIGHSLGGMSVINAIREGLNVKKAVCIGSGDSIQDIIDDFIQKLHIHPKYGGKLRDYFERKFGSKMEDYSTSVAAKKVAIPILIVHDTNDDDVPVKAAYSIASALSHSELFITTGLGHRKILGNKEVINRIIEFIKT